MLSLHRLCFAQDVQIMSAGRCLLTAAKCGFLVVADALLEQVPELLDYRIEGVPEPGTNDYFPLLIACASTNMSGEARVQMVQLLLDRFRARAEQHGQAVIFSSIGGQFQIAWEYRALQAARSNGHTAVESLLLAAGVPSELDPIFLRRGLTNEGVGAAKEGLTNKAYGCRPAAPRPPAMPSHSPRTRRSRPSWHRVMWWHHGTSISSYLRRRQQRRQRQLLERDNANEGLTNTMEDQNVLAGGGGVEGGGGAAARGVITDEAFVQAMRLFGGNSPMAWGYLVGSLGLEDRPPAGGWESCDPGAVKAKAGQERKLVEAQVNEYRSRLLFAESERLRDELLRDQDDLLRDQAELLQRDGAPVLFAFVCNPDRTPTVRRQRLPMALNDALAASRFVAASIFGGTYSDPGTTVGEAAAEDRTCTFERLEEELSSKQYRIFLFSGHANLQDAERQKTLGFTGSDGKFAPVVDARKVAELLGCVCSPIKPHPTS